MVKWSTTRNIRQVWMKGNGRNTQFGTNCGRLPDVCRTAKRGGTCRCAGTPYFCIKNPGRKMTAG